MCINVFLKFSSSSIRLLVYSLLPISLAIHYFIWFDAHAVALLFLPLFLAVLSPAQLIRLLPWGKVCPSSGVFGSEMICLERLILALRPTLATRLVKWLIMLWRVKEPRPAVWTHVGDNILHIVSAEMRKVGEEDRQRGVKLGAMRVEVGAQSTRFMWLDKRETQKHMKKEGKKLCWVGVIICMCLLWMKSLSELVTGCLDF